jgi:hypothetical protein
MKKQYSVILDEFKTQNFISLDKLKAYQNEKISIENLNIHESNVIKNKKSYKLLPYNTLNIYDLHSYYLIEFDHKVVKDIIEIRIIEEKLELKNNRYIKNGFKLYDIVLMSENKEKKVKFSTLISSIIKEHMSKYEGMDINFDHPDSIMEVIDPINNLEKYLN